MDARSSWLPTVERILTGLAVLGLLVLTATVLFSGGGLWRDEVNSLTVASEPSLVAIWTLLEFESFPALWPLLLAVWSRAVGDGDLALRLFGVLGGLSLPAAIWFAAGRLGRSLPLVSLALVAMNPEVMRWGSSVRAWGLGAALAILVLVFVWEAARRQSLSATAQAIVIAVLAVQCTYQNAFFVFAFVCAAAGVTAWEKGLRAAIAPLTVGAVAAASLVPYLGTLRRVGEWSMLNEVSLTASVVLARLFRVAFSAGSIVLVCWVGLAMAALAVTALRAIRVTPRPTARPDSVATYAVLSMVLATAALVTLYTLAHYPPYTWYYLALIAVVAVCAEVAIRTTARSATAGVVMASAALTVLLVGFPSAWSAVRQPLTNLDAIGVRLTAETSPTDLVIANPWLYGISLRRYYQGAAPLVTVPDLADFSVHRFDLLKAQMGRDGVTDTLIGRIEATLRADGRVWVVGDDPVPEVLPSDPPLPSPPLPDSGWSVRPYILSWGRQVGVALGRHAVERDQVAIAVTAQPLENARLLVFRGWRDGDDTEPGAVRIR